MFGTLERPVNMREVVVDRFERSRRGENIDLSFLFAPRVSAPLVRRDWIDAVPMPAAFDMPAHTGRDVSPPVVTIDLDAVFQKTKTAPLATIVPALHLPLSTTALTLPWAGRRPVPRRALAALPAPVRRQQAPALALPADRSRNLEVSTTTKSVQFPELNGTVSEGKSNTVPFGIPRFVPASAFVSLVADNVGILGASANLFRRRTNGAWDIVNPEEMIDTEDQNTVYRVNQVYVAS